MQGVYKMHARCIHDVFRVNTGCMDILTFIEHHHNFLEELHKVHIVVTVFLYLLQQDQLNFRTAGECLQRGGVCFQVA